MTRPIYNAPKVFPRFGSEVFENSDIIRAASVIATQGEEECLARF